LLRLIFFASIFLFTCPVSFASDFFSPGDDSSVVSVSAPEDSSFRKINSVTLIGNKKTKREIILRELTFNEGDSIRQDKINEAIQRSKENLLNTSLFNFVDVFYKPADTLIDIIIVMSERWYIWPLPIFEIVDRNLNEWLLTKDFSRTNYGLYLAIYNFRGRNETLALGFRDGYTKKYSLQYSIPYVSKNQKEGISFSVAYSRNHEIAYTTSKNKLVYHDDDDIFVKQEFYASAQMTFRRKLYNTFMVRIEYDDMELSDTIPLLNHDYFTAQAKRQRFKGLTLLFKSDHRDLVSYPLHGTYFEAEYFQRGFDFLGDDIAQPNLYSSFRYYTELKKNIYFATGLKGKFSGPSKQPYNITRALGYGRDYVRGYEYYVINGQNFLLLKNNLKFRLLPTFVKKFNFIPSEKFSTIPFSFYLNAFYDMGYVDDQQYFQNNSLTNTLLPGYGIGIDFVSYYDVVFSFTSLFPFDEHSDLRSYILSAQSQRCEGNFRCHLQIRHEVRHL
jgi:outer membrane protein assembly factor BamA